MSKTYLESIGLSSFENPFKAVNIEVDRPRDDAGLTVGFALNRAVHLRVECLHTKQLAKSLVADVEDHRSTKASQVLRGQLSQHQPTLVGEDKAYGGEIILSKPAVIATGRSAGYCSGSRRSDTPEMALPISPL